MNFRVTRASFVRELLRSAFRFSVRGLSGRRERGGGGQERKRERRKRIRLTTSALIIHDTLDTYVPRHLLPSRDFSTYVTFARDTADLSFSLSSSSPTLVLFDAALSRVDQDLSIPRGHLLFEEISKNLTLDRPGRAFSSSREWNTNLGRARTISFLFFTFFTNEDDGANRIDIEFSSGETKKKRLG